MLNKRINKKNTKLKFMVMKKSILLSVRNKTRVCANIMPGPRPSKGQKEKNTVVTALCRTCRISDLWSTRNLVKGIFVQTILMLSMVISISANKVNAQGRDSFSYECITNFSDDECTNHLEIQYILPLNKNTQRFIEKGIDSVLAEVYIGGIYKASVALERDPIKQNVWKKEIGVKKYNTLKYHFKYQIVTKQKTGLRRQTRIKYSLGRYSQSERFQEGYDYIYTTSPGLHIPHGSVGIGAIGYSYCPAPPHTTIYDKYSIYGNLLHTTFDFGIGLKLGFSLVEWNYMPFNSNSNYLNDSLTTNPENGVHIFSLPKVQLAYDIRLYNHVAVPCRTFRPYHFTLSPFFSYKPLEWVVFNKSLKNFFTYSKSMEAGMRLHSSLYFVDLVYTFRRNDPYFLNNEQINLRNPGTLCLRVGIKFDWYN